MYQLFAKLHLALQKDSFNYAAKTASQQFQLESILDYFSNLLKEATSIKFNL